VFVVRLVVLDAAERSAQARSLGLGLGSYALRL